MHRKVPISVLVYNALFPNPAPTDPPSFSAHLTKNLVGEVRIETATFYGSLDAIEARYPGLNYAHAPHRRRLGRFPHHKKLFDAFDRLGLTDSEIQGFCRWEGTLWARERYERDEGVKIYDTTANEIGEWVDRRKNRTAAAAGASRDTAINVKTDIEVEIEQVAGSRLDTEMHHDDESEEEDEDDEEQHVSESVGFELNQRLLQAAAMRERGVNVTMDPEWEQYLKEAQERGELNLDVDTTRDVLRTMAGQLAHVNQPGPASFQPPAAPA